MPPRLRTAKGQEACGAARCLANNARFVKGRDTNRGRAILTLGCAGLGQSPAHEPLRRFGRIDSVRIRLGKQCP